MKHPDGVWYKITISKEPDYLLNTMYSVYPYNIKNFNLYAWVCNGIRDVCGTKDRIQIERYNADKTVDIIFKMEGE
jgi:predicted nucleic acid-binding Zn finger protein